MDDDDEVLENKNSCTMAGGEPTYLVMRGGNPGDLIPSSFASEIMLQDLIVSRRMAKSLLNSGPHKLPLPSTCILSIPEVGKNVQRTEIR